MNATALPAFDIERLIGDQLPAARRGDHAAYGRIVEACQSSVSAIALAIVRDVPTSEDIAQEAFLKAWQGLDRLRNHASFLPWLRQITRNLARDHLRATRHRPLTGEVAELAIGMAADSADTPEERLRATEEEAAAAELISALPEDARETLLLYYREGQQSKQVAALLGLTDAAVRKRLSRARAAVREELLQRFGTFARTSAPGAAFTAMVVGGLAMSAPAVGTAAVVGTGLVGGAGKLGGSAVTASGGVAGGSLGMVASQWLGTSQVLPVLLLGVLAGALGSSFTWWYLARFARSPAQHREIRRFVLLMCFIGIVWSLALMVALSLKETWLTLLVAAAGLAAVNHQHMTQLKRMMAPMLADPANRRWSASYPWVMGRPACVVSSLFVVVALLVLLMTS